MKINSMLAQQLDALLTDEHNNVANMANASALLMQELPMLAGPVFTHM